MNCIFTKHYNNEYNEYNINNEFSWKCPPQVKLLIAFCGSFYEGVSVIFNDLSTVLYFVLHNRRDSGLL